MITYVIPAKNEEKTIKEVIKKINEISNKLFNKNPNIIVVSDSVDKTDEICQEFKNCILIESNNRGLGYAMYLGLKKASKTNCDYICSIDSDGQVDLNEIELFYKKIVGSNLDLVTGSRFLENELINYKYKNSNKIGTVILKSIINLITKYKVTDSHGGIRIMKKKVASKLKMIGDYTYVQETLIDASENNFNHLEIPSKWNLRKHGESKVVRNKLKYAFNVGPVLFCRGNLHKILLYPISLFIMILTTIFLIFKSINFNTFLLSQILSFVIINFAYGIEQYINNIYSVRSDLDKNN